MTASTVHGGTSRRNVSAEPERKLAAAARRGLHRQQALVERHDLPRHAQPDAAAAALGREERQENIVHVRRVDAGTVVDHLDQYLAALVARAAQEDAAAVAPSERLGRVLQEVDQHLLDLLRI